MRRVAIVGMGTMGSAISDLLRDAFDVVEIWRDGSLRVVASVDIVVLAIKPQQFVGLATDVRQFIDSQTVVSIMAGVTIESLARSLGTTRIVRTMPNLALKTGQSLTAWYAEDEAVDLAIVQDILVRWGRSLRLESEAQFDAFTALAGSGPAYFFELARVLEVAARQRGFSTVQARSIAAQILAGAAGTVGLEADFAALTHSVASKGGTTEVALGVLRQDGFEQMILSAVGAAVSRSQQLGREH